MANEDDPMKLRYNAEHCRRLAKILVEEKAAAELLELAGQLDARALKIEAERRRKQARPEE